MRERRAPVPSHALPGVRRRRSPAGPSHCGRPESEIAASRSPSLPGETRTLVVYGDSFRHDRGPALAELYGAEQLDAGAATHYDMVLDRALRERVAERAARGVTDVMDSRDE